MSRRPPTIPDTEAGGTEQPTVTIRPFDVLGDDPQSALLARGITADLITDLSKVSGLRVIDVAPLGKQASADVTGRHSADPLCRVRERRARR